MPNKIDAVWNLQDGEKAQVKLISGRILKPATIERHGKRLIIKFGWDKNLLTEIKSMPGRKWHGHADAPKPKGKHWSVPMTERIKFHLSYLLGDNPYGHYDQPLTEYKSERRPLYIHQNEFVSFVLNRRHCLIAGEMGTGKTVSVGEAVEEFGELEGEFWYIAPKSALKAVERDFKKWSISRQPIFMTYDEMKKRVLHWVSGTKAPQIVIFDESSLLKNPKAQRTECAQALADGIRSDWGLNSLIVCMTGSPAPKSPLDWWSQCEIVRPGFLKEGTLYDFERRLAILSEEQSITGGTYSRRVAWREDTNICDKCGKKRDDLVHDFLLHHEPHEFIASENEVARLHKRMAGLVLVKFKRDCLDLPEKRYELINVQPTQETLRLAKVLQARATTAIQAMTWLRELSDGFQYVEVETGEVEPCAVCHGSGQMKEWFDPEDPESSLDPHFEIVINRQVELLPTFTDDNDDTVYIIDGMNYYEREVHSAIDSKAAELSNRYDQRLVKCVHCGGAGSTPKHSKVAKQIPCPKEDAMFEELELHEEVGRLVAYAGFFGSVERVVDIAHRAAWHVVKADGKGWKVTDPDNNALSIDPLEMFMDRKLEYPRVCFVGQPDAAGMGLTLTASPTIVYYSNTFNAQGRIQSEDRIHRPGMDVERGATIKDMIHLPSDLYILQNLQKKRELQAITLGEMADTIKQLEASRMTYGVQGNTFR